MNASKALLLIASQPQRLTDRGHALLNSGLAECLQLGWVQHAPRNATGYELTAKGKATMSAMRTGIPLTTTRSTSRGRVRAPDDH